MTARNGAALLRRLALAAGMLLAFAALPPAAAQAQDTLVSNLDRIQNFSRGVDSDRSWAGPFRTGSAAHGYTLHSISLDFEGPDDIDSGAFTATLRASATNGAPGAVEHTLANPSPILNRGVNEFTAPAGAVLTADTRYHVVLEYSSDSTEVRWSWADGGVDPASADGWDIVASRYWRIPPDQDWDSFIGSWAMAVKGRAILPTVAVESVASPVEEGNGAQFRVTRTEVTAGALTVSYDVSETGDMAAGETGAGTVDFADGETERTVTVPTVDDALDEADSTVTLALAEDDAYRVDASQASAAVTVQDDDEPALSIADASVAEGDTGSAALAFTVTLVPAQTGTVTVDWETSDGTAVDPADYTAASGSLTFSPGETARTVSVTVAGDTVDEPNETFTVVLSNPVGAELRDGTATGTITDDDDTPTATLSLDPDSIAEAGGVSRVAGSLSHASSARTTMLVSVTPVPPAAAGDFTLDENSLLVIPAGETASTNTVAITAVANDTDAADKALTVATSLVTNAHGLPEPPEAVTLTIGDDDDQPVVTLQLQHSSIGEADGTSRVTARLSHPSDAATTVTVSAAPVAPADEGDYTLSANTVLTIAAGDRESTGVVAITSVNNLEHAPDKEVTVSGVAENARGRHRPGRCDADDRGQ